MNRIAIAITACTLIIWGCSGQQKDAAAHKRIEVQTDTVVKKTPPLFTKLCQSEKFEVLGICNPLPVDSNEYRVLLDCDPFKDFVLLSVKFPENKPLSIYYCTFHFAVDNSKRIRNRKPKFDIIDSISAINHTVVYFACPFPQKPKKPFKKVDLEKIRTFFNDYFWTCKEDDCSGMFDGEYWTVESNFGGNYRKVRKCKADDPRFYEPIDILLKACHIRQYSFLYRG